MSARPPARRLVWRALWLVILVGLTATGCAASISSSTGARSGADSGAGLDDALAAAAQAAFDGDDAADVPEQELTLTPSETAEADASETSDLDASDTDEDEAASDSVDLTSGTEDEAGSDAEPINRNEALPPAPIGFDALTLEDQGPQPISLEIENIDVVDAAIIPVGVNPDQTFEVPPADEVGWYRFGPTPGGEGSAVLAAHIAFDGVDGVFRRLADVEVGAIVIVGFDDGTSQRYEITSLTDYVKEELPPELFARTGDSQLALITCGGAFNRQLRSYDSNTVAIAVPV